MKPALVVLAAGLGSRYGSDKQLAAVGPAGEPILWFTAVDAAAAGFGELVLVVRPELEAATESLVGGRLRRLLPLRYVHQRSDRPLPGLRAPAGRSRPWGTAHALHAAIAGLDGPCGVVNADDWYGPPALADLASWLAWDGAAAGLIAFRLGRTLSPHGAVNRGIVTADGGRVVRIAEAEGLAMAGSGAGTADGQVLPGATPVSMNLWGLRPALYAPFRHRVEEELLAHVDDARWECQLPTIIMQGLSHGDWQVDFRMTDADWCGMTYPADRPAVRERLARHLAGAA